LLTWIFVFMPVKSFRPLTPSTRYITIADFSDITKTTPEKRLVITRKKTGGRNHYGRVTTRGLGGGHKQKIRLVDFKRNKHGVEAKVAAIEYDPMRSARLALLEYKDGEKRYIIAPVGIQVGAAISSGPAAPPEIGNALPLKSIPVGIAIHNIELTPGRGGQMVRSAGGAATLMSRDEGYAQIRLPSGEIRKVNGNCYATIGQVGNTEHENVSLGKAGRSRRPSGAFGGRRGDVDVARRGLRANPPALRRNPQGARRVLRDHRPGGQHGAREYHFGQSGPHAASWSPRHQPRCDAQSGGSSKRRRRRQVEVRRWLAAIDVAMGQGGQGRQDAPQIPLLKPFHRCPPQRTANQDQIIYGTLD
jgi:large subunit ribosomal protein L2